MFRLVHGQGAAFALDAKRDGLDAEMRPVLAAMRQKQTADRLKNRLDASRVHLLTRSEVVHLLEEAYFNDEEARAEEMQHRGHPGRISRVVDRLVDRVVAEQTDHRRAMTEEALDERFGKSQLRFLGMAPEDVQLPWLSDRADVNHVQKQKKIVEWGDMSWL